MASITRPKKKTSSSAKKLYTPADFSKDTEPFIERILTAYETLPAMISFTIEHKGLPSTYLNKILGNKSHASDIMNGIRPPSLTEMVIINRHLGISYDVQMALRANNKITDRKKYVLALNELIKNGVYKSQSKKDKERLIDELIAKDIINAEAQSACFRQSLRKNSKANSYALELFVASASRIAKEHIRISLFNPKKLDELMGRIVHELSPVTHGIKRVEKLLLGYGIKFVMMKHLKGTFLDGVVFLDEEGQPVIVMTGRYDRVDNFWFTLLHELAHIKLGHLEDNPIIFDDLDIFSDDEIEKEADKLAVNTALAEDKWSEFDLDDCTASDIYDFAIENKVSPAIVAGRIRFETKNYRAFASLVGNGGVRKYFPEVFDI